VIAARRINEDDCKVLLHPYGRLEGGHRDRGILPETCARRLGDPAARGQRRSGVHRAIKEQPQGRTASASRLLWSALLAVQSSKESLNEAGPSLLFYVHTTPRYSTGGSSGHRNALTWLSLQSEIDANRLGVWGSSFSGGHVIQVAAHDSRVKAVVSQAGAMDLNQIIHTVAGPEMFASLQQLTVQERIRHATEGGEKYIPSTGRPGESFVLFQGLEQFYLLGWPCMSF
jgi:hypothetical protein